MQRYLLSAQYIEDKDEYYNILTEYLMFTVKGQAYIQDIKFNKLPFNDYNITVCKMEYLRLYTHTCTPVDAEKFLTKNDVRPRRSWCSIFP